MNKNLDYRNNIDKTKNLYNINKCLDLLNHKNKLEQIGEGFIGNIFYANSPQCGSIVLKIYKDKENKKAFKREKIFIKLIQKIILNDTCPNFINTYYTDDKYILMEYADGDLYKLFIENIDLDKDIIENINFQILIGILVMQKKLFMVHNDLFLKNIFYKKISTTNIKYFEYNINGEKYYLKNVGYFIMIADFGNCQSILFDQEINWYNYVEINNMIRNNDDFNHLLLNYYLCVSVYIIVNNIKSLDELFKFININEPNINKFYNHNLEIYKNEKNNKEYKILEKMLMYCVMNKIIDYNKYIDKSNIYMCSNDFKIFIERIYNKSEDVYMIIKKNFNDYKNINISLNFKNQIKQFYINYETFN